jgi:Na+/H+ antiporter NhaD/arsenite permease-like protein
MPHPISSWELLPFLLALVSFALLPSVAPALWERRWFRLVWAIGLAAPAILAAACRGAGTELIESARDYVDFLLLMGTLYVVSGGIAVGGRLEGTPTVNVALLAGGSLLASLLGTAGAATLLIRPYLHANRRRHQVWHGVVLLIILVGNVGGALLPTGDPPLYLGFLHGVPFFWTLGLWREWLITVLTLLLIFFLWDRHLFRKEGFRGEEDAHSLTRLHVSGLGNLPILVAAIAASALLRGLPRNVALILCIAASAWVTPKGLRRKHGFSFDPIEELAWVFFAVFATIVPVLDWLPGHAHELSVTTPRQFFWASGCFSALLDSAPAYLTAFALARDLGPPGKFAGMPEMTLRAISLGTVLFGALTYVGNGPNLLVRGIARERGVRMPGFFAYAATASALLLPLFCIIALVFL